MPYCFITIRYYIISQLPRLNVLDDTVVTSIERENAAKLFGPKRINSAVLKKRNMQVSHFDKLYSVVVCNNSVV